MHPSDSTVQLEAEPLLRAALAEDLGVELASHTLPVGDVTVDLDGFSPGPPPVAVEIYSRVGESKGSALHKPNTDVVKLTLVRRVHADCRLILVFADPRVAAPFTSPGRWRAAALQELGIEVRVIEPTEELRAKLSDAALRQYR